MLSKLTYAKRILYKQFLGFKWQDGCHLVPVDVTDKIVAMAPPTNKKETQMFLGMVVFWQMHICRYSQLGNPLYQVTRKELI